MKFKSNDVFPLVKSTFVGVDVFVPQRTVAVLDQSFVRHDIFGPPWPKCSLGRYSHQTEKELFGEEVSVDCKLLKDRFNFTEQFWAKVKKRSVTEITSVPTWDHMIVSMKQGSVNVKFCTFIIGEMFICHANNILHVKMYCDTMPMVSFIYICPCDWVKVWFSFTCI